MLRFTLAKKLSASSAAPVCARAGLRGKNGRNLRATGVMLKSCWQSSRACTLWQRDLLGAVEHVGVVCHLWELGKGASL